MRRRIVFFFSVVLLACTCVFSHDYEIRITRPFQAGSRYELKGTASISKILTVHVGENVVRDDKSVHSATLDGTIVVLQIDDQGRPNKVKLLVSKFTIREKGSTETKGLPDGSVIVAQSTDNKTRFSIDNKPVSNDIAEMLALFISIPSTPTTDDDIFGTENRKKVGDSWEVDRTRTAQDFTQRGLKIDAESISGRTTLVRTVSVEDTNCLLLSAKVTVDKAGLPLPPGFVAEKSTISATFEGTFPVDISIPCLSEKKSLESEVLAKGRPDPNSPEASLHMKRTSKVELKERLLAD